MKNMIFFMKTDKNEITNILIIVNMTIFFIDIIILYLETKILNIKYYQHSIK